MIRGLVGTLVAIVAGSNALAASTSFQSPNTASWGDWQRGDAGSLYVHWERFDAFLPLGFPSALPDSTPDRARIGVKSATLIPNNPGAFITGSGAGGNVYSFGDINDFDVIVQAVDGFPLGPLTVALQVSVVGTDFDDASIKLNGARFTSKTVLATGSAAAPGGVGGTGNGVDNEYLYLWQNVQRVSAAVPFFFDLRALGTSNSLDALAIDIGPRALLPVTPAPPDTPAPVPLPGALGLLALGLCSFVVRARSSA